MQGVHWLPLGVRELKSAATPYQTVLSLIDSLEWHQLQRCRMRLMREGELALGYYLTVDNWML